MAMVLVMRATTRPLLWILTVMGSLTPAIIADLWPILARRIVTATALATPVKIRPWTVAEHMRVFQSFGHQIMNSRLVEVLGVTGRDGDSITINIDGVSQDEPVNGIGDGDVSPDAIGINTSTVQLRAERSGTANGRVYHIAFTATDRNGGTCRERVLVTVPLNRGRHGVAVDDGPLYDSTVP